MSFKKQGVSVMHVKLSFDKTQVTENPDGTMTVTLSDRQAVMVRRIFDMENRRERFRKIFSEFWSEKTSDNIHMLGFDDDLPKLSEKAVLSAIADAYDYRSEKNGERMDGHESVRISMDEAFTHVLEERLEGINDEINAIGDMVSSSENNGEHGNMIYETVMGAVRIAVNERLLGNAPVREDEKEDRYRKMINRARAGIEKENWLREQIKKIKEKQNA